MVKPTRSATGRGNDRAAKSRALMGVASTIANKKNGPGLQNPVKTYKENKTMISSVKKAKQLETERQRHSVAGTRLARIQRATKLKNK